MRLEILVVDAFIADLPVRTTFASAVAGFAGVTRSYHFVQMPRLTKHNRPPIADMKGVSQGRLPLGWRFRSFARQARDEWQPAVSVAHAWACPLERCYGITAKDEDDAIPWRGSSLAHPASEPPLHSQALWTIALP